MAVSDRPETEFAALARRLATRKITDVAELPDGSVVLRYASDTAPPEPESPAVQDRLDQLTRKIDALTEDRLERERLSDRLAAVEFALLPTLTDEGSAPVLPQGHPGENPLHMALQPNPGRESVLQALQSAEDRILARLHDAVAQIDLTDLAMSDPPEARGSIGADVLGLLARLDQRLDDLARQPPPILDLTLQRERLAGFLTSVGTAIARLEHNIVRLAAHHPDTMALDRLAEVEATLATLPAQFAALTPDPTAQLTRLANEVQRLGTVVDSLSATPAPVLDLTAQRESFARFATSVSHVIARMEHVADKIGFVPEPKLPDAVTERLDRIERLLSAHAAPSPRMQLTDAILTLSDRLHTFSPPADAPRSAPQIAASDPLHEHYRAQQDDFFQDMRFVLAELIATQMKTRKQDQTAAA